MTSPTKEVHQFYDFYRQDGPPFRFKHPKSLGDSSSRRDRDDSKMLADTSTGLSRIRSDIESSRLRSEIDARKDKKDVFASKRLSFADPVSGSKRHDRLSLERELDEASTQIEELRQKNRSLRHQLNLANQEREQQSKDREKAISMWEKSRMDHKRLLNEIEIMKKEKLILKQHLADQTDFQDEDLAGRLSEAVKQVQQLTIEKDDIQGRLLDEMEHIKDSLDEAINDRDAMKFQISELLREKEKLLDKVSAIAPGFEATKSELDKVIEQRDLLKVQSKDLKRENEHLYSRLSNRSSPERSDTEEVESLREKCASLEQEREELLIKIETMRSERQCSVTSTDDEGVGSMSGYRSDEDYRTRIAALEVDKCSLEDKLETAETEVSGLQRELTSAKEQIKHVLREKGVALRESTATYEEFVQLQSQVIEVQAERDCATEHRKAAAKEKERVITENVGLKIKLDAIMLQRQKDAKELGTMRRARGQAHQELSEVKKHYRELKDKSKQSEYELSLLAEIICSQLNIEKKGSVSSLLHRYMEQVQLEKDSFLSRLFGGQKYATINLSDACARLDAILHEKTCLTTELERLQKQSRNEKDKEKVTKLTEQVNNLTFERDALQEQVDKLESKISRHAAELKRCSTEIQHLQEDKNELKISHTELVEKHAKTLERIDDLWKHRSKPQSQSVHWNEYWDEKQIVLEVDTAGSAGFAIMGGRDQQQLPNPSAIVVTEVVFGSPAHQQLMPGDVIESVNGVNLSNVDHQDAICAIKENKGPLCLVVRRNKSPMAISQILSGAGAPVDPNTEEYDFSLLIQKDGIGFKHQWTISYEVTEILHGGPAHQILRSGDKITRVNGVEVSHVKASVFRKMLKPQKGVLKLHIVRHIQDNQETTPSMYSSYSSSSTTRHHSTSSKTYSRSSSEVSNDIGPEAVVVDKDTSYRPNSRNSYSSRSSSNYGGYGRNRVLSRENSGAHPGHESPTRLKGSLYSPRVHAEQPSRDEQCLHKAFEDQPDSQDSIGTGYSNMPTKLVLSSQDSLCTGSSCSSQSSGSRVTFADSRPLKRGMRRKYGSVDYDSNNNSNNRMFDELSNSQSINLSFHSQSFISHNQLTVETTQTLTGSDDDEPYSLAPFARDDVHRSTVRTRSMSSLNDNRISMLHLSNGYQAESEYSQCSQPSQPIYSGSMRPKAYSTSSNKSASSLWKKDRGGSTSRIAAGRRNTTPTGSTISGSTITSARSLSNIDDGKYNEYDPLCNASYLRANFSYVPRYRKELRVSIGDVFHIHDESPEHHKASFWVGRINSDGTDSAIGAIPNSPRAKYYIEDQGEDVFCPVYTEVEPCRDPTPRPILIFGVALEPVIVQLLDEYPDTFVSPEYDILEDVSKSKVEEEIRRGKIISYTQVSSSSFKVLTFEMIKKASKKGKHCLLVGDMTVHQILVQLLPPISIFIKAQTPESISTFDPCSVNPQDAREKFQQMEKFEREHGHNFSATLLLIMLELLVGQIYDKVIEEQKKVSWVPVKRDL